MFQRLFRDTALQTMMLVLEYTDWEVMTSLHNVEKNIFVRKFET